jgi:hypothetical protein
MATSFSVPFFKGNSYEFSPINNLAVFDILSVNL